MLQLARNSESDVAYDESLEAVSGSDDNATSGRDNIYTISASGESIMFYSISEESYKTIERFENVYFD